VSSSRDAAGRDGRKRKAGSVERGPGGGGGAASEERQVVLAVSAAGESRWHVIFTHCGEAGAVLARCSAGSGAAVPFLLEALERGDCGCAWPEAPPELPAALHRTARPFRWCQWLAGQGTRAGGGAVDVQRLRSERRAAHFVRLLRLRHSQLTAL
jgi:hypothetical protein